LLGAILITFLLYHKGKLLEIESSMMYNKKEAPEGALKQDRRKMNEILFSVFLIHARC